MAAGTHMTSRTIAGIVLGFTLSCGIGGLYTVFGPQAHSENLIVALMVMLLIWIAAWASSYAVASASRAWGWLLAANLVVHVLLWVSRHQHWGGWAS